MRLDHLLSRESALARCARAIPGRSLFPRKGGEGERGRERTGVGQGLSTFQVVEDRSSQVGGAGTAARCTLPTEQQEEVKQTDDLQFCREQKEEAREDHHSKARGTCVRSWPSLGVLRAAGPQAGQRSRWMPGRVSPMKDAETGETFKGSCMRARSLESPNGATPPE